MNQINTNLSSLLAQTHLSRANADLQSALTRLSTGLRINSGADDPAGLIASEDLRRDITAIEKAVSNSERAIGMIATADSALGQVSNLLNDIRGLVTEAANRGALSDEQIAANQLQIDSSLEAIDRISQTTTFQGRRLLDGSLAFTTNANPTAFQDLRIDQANLGATGEIDVTVDIIAAATQAEVTTTFNDRGEFTITDLGTGSLTFAVTQADPSAPDLTVNVLVNPVGSSVTGNFIAGTGVLTLTFGALGPVATADDIISAIETAGGTDLLNVANTGGTGAITPATATPGVVAVTNSKVLADDVAFQLTGTDGADVFTFEANTTIAQLEAAINLISDATGVRAAATGAELALTSTAFGSNSRVDVEVLDEGNDGEFSSGLSATRANGTDIEATVNGFNAKGNGNTLSINTATLDLSLTALANSTADVVFKILGGGALFQLGPDVVSTQQARIGVGSVNTGKLGGPTGRLYELRSGGASELSADPTRAATIVDEAIGEVTQLRGRLGAFQRTTLESNIASLSDTLINLTDAQSAIRDADFAAETAALTRAQILVQSGTAVLSIANQNPQNVLALLR